MPLIQRKYFSTLASKLICEDFARKVFDQGKFLLHRTNECLDFSSSRSSFGHKYTEVKSDLEKKERKLVLFVEDI